MLRKNAHKRVTVDKSLLAEIGQLNNLQFKLAKEQGVASNIQKLASKVVNLADEDGIATSVVFLTEKKSNPSILKVLSWLGINQKLDDSQIFEGKLTGTIALEEQQTTFKIQLFHFDHYPVRVFPESYRALNIIVFDSNYRAKFPNWDLAVQVLGMDPSVCLCIDISEANTVEVGQVPKIQAIHTKYIHVANFNYSVKLALVDEELLQAIQFAKILKHLEFTEYIQHLIAEDLGQMEKRWMGKAMLLYKKEQQLQERSDAQSDSELSELKLRIGKGYKNLIKFTDNKIGSLDNTAPEYRTLEEEITSFLGFLETKSSRYLILKISEGAVHDKMQKANTLLCNFFGNLVNEMNEVIVDMESDIKARFKLWQLASPDINTAPLNDHFTKELLATSLTLPDKPYEKQIMAKGIGSLLMELRTPLFMLMPFMMIFALFASLVGEADEGHINQNILFHDNRPVIAIDELPESLNHEFGRFIGKIESYNAPGKGIFEKGIEGELTTEPQLAIKLIEVPQTYGNTTKTVQKLDYFFDSKAQTMYLFLNPNADRNFVIDKLYSPELELLTIPTSTRRGFGIGGLIRIISSLSEYRYIIFIGLLSLISWFIITRKSSMDAELASTKIREQSKLNNDLKQHVDKTVKGVLQKWKTKLVAELTDRENMLLKKTERTLTRNVESQRRHKVQEKKALQKRTAALKSEKTKISNFKSEFRKVRTKHDLIQTKKKRLLR